MSANFKRRVSDQPPGPDLDPPTGILWALLLAAAVFVTPFIILWLLV